MNTASPIPILLYHAVSAEPPPWLARWSVTPDEFRAHLDAVLRAGCTPFTVSGLVDLLRRDEPLPERPLVVTFDDGFADLASQAAPAMHEREIVGTAYITTGAMQGTRAPNLLLPPVPMLAWSQLAELEEMGIELGAHSHTHPQLDTIRRQRASEEIDTSKELLEGALGHRVRSFAYPHGYSNGVVRQLVANAGFDSACAVRNAFSSPFDNLFMLARLTVRSDTSLRRIESWIVGEDAPVAGVHELWQTRGWRHVRRARVRLATAHATARRRLRRPGHVEAASDVDSPAALDGDQSAH